MKFIKILAVSTLSTMLLSSCASTSTQTLSDGFGKVLNTTGSILNAVTGGSTTGSSYPNTKSNLIKIAGKETSEYKFENMTINLSQFSPSDPVGLLTGEFHNKTNRKLHFQVTIPVYDSKGFSIPAISYDAVANAHEKVRIQDLRHFTAQDHKPDVSKVKYEILKY